MEPRKLDLTWRILARAAGATALVFFLAWAWYLFVKPAGTLSFAAYVAGAFVIGVGVMTGALLATVVRK